jgi:two-component system KDP operon response regulator KdpE
MKMKILIIEDDKYISNFIAVSLEKDHYEVLIAESASAGMFMVSSHHPDLILLDLGLPDRDGLHVIQN